MAALRRLASLIQLCRSMRIGRRSAGPGHGASGVDAAAAAFSSGPSTAFEPPSPAAAEDPDSDSEIELSCEFPERLMLLVLDVFVDIITSVLLLAALDSDRPAHATRFLSCCACAARAVEVEQTEDAGAHVCWRRSG